MTEDDWMKSINAAEPSLTDLEELEALLTKSDLPGAVKERLRAWVRTLIGRAKNKIEEAKKVEEEEESRKRRSIIKPPRG